MDLTYALSFWAKFSCVDSAVLHTAFRLGVFERILEAGADGLTTAQLAQRIDASPRGTRILVEPLVASKLLRADDAGAITVEPEAAPALRDAALRERIVAASAWWTASTRLLDALRSGEAVREGERIWDVLGQLAELFPREPKHEAGDPVAAELFDRAVRHFWRTQALACAADLNLFERLDDTPQSVEALAAPSEVTPDGLTVLLDSMVNMGILIATGEGYRYHPSARVLLDQRNVGPYSQGLGLITAYWDALGRLDEAVLHDRRTVNFNNTALGEQYYLKLARYNTAIFPSYFGLIREVPKALQQGRPLQHARALDVGAGSGVWGAAFAHAEPTLQVSFFDQPQVLSQTRRNMERLKLADRAHFWPGNLLDADFGESAFDLILLGQVCHTQDPADLPDLFARLVRALRPDGVIALADSVLNDRRDDPIDYLFFGIKMFVATSGEVLSLAEYTRLLADAGLPAYRYYKLPGTSIDLIVASRTPYALPDQITTPVRQTVEL